MHVYRQVYTDIYNIYIHVYAYIASLYRTGNQVDCTVNGNINQIILKIFYASVF